LFVFALEHAAIQRRVSEFKKCVSAQAPRPKMRFSTTLIAFAFQHAPIQNRFSAGQLLFSALWRPAIVCFRASSPGVCSILHAFSPQTPPKRAPPNDWLILIWPTCILTGREVMEGGRGGAGGVGGPQNRCQNMFVQKKKFPQRRVSELFYVLNI